MRIVSFTLVCIVISACNTRYVDQKKGEAANGNSITSRVLYTVHESFRRSPPQCIAVLSFKTKEAGADVNGIDLVRRGIYAHLSPKGYRHVELQRVDYVTSKIGIDSRNIAGINALGASLNCDAFITGEINDFGSSFFGVYSRVSVSASLRMLRASDGALLWEATHTAELQDGDIPFSPIGVASGMFRAARNVQEEQTLRVVDDLARRLMHTIPNVSIRSTEEEGVSSLFKKSRGLIIWKGDVDTYLQEIGEYDMEAAILDLLKHQPLSNLQKETAYSRLIAVAKKSRYYRMWGIFRYERGDYEGALEFFEKAAGLDKEDAEAWYLQGRMLAKLNRLADAGKRLIRAIVINESQADYYAAYAYVNSLMGHHDRARVSYEMSLKLNQKSAFSWYNLAVMDFNEGNMEEAARKFYTAGQQYLENGSYDKVERVINDLQDMEDYWPREGIQGKIKFLQSRLKQQTRG